MHNDLTFFTNEPNATLLDRFRKTLKDSIFFDILVGYFRTSGFFRLYGSFETIDKIRILVGINVDTAAFEIIESAKAHQKKINFESHKRTKDIFSEGLASEMEHSEDTYDTEVGVRKFIEFLQSGKLEIKAYPSTRIHAKVYISNFSESGLVENLEFNVELKNSADVKYALEKFEALWKDAVDISREYVETIATRTWLNDHITPYELYLKFLYEYLKEDINMDEDFEAYLPEGFLELKYQKQAVVSAKKILDAYNGVFLSDVVGLGKTYISALLAQQLSGKILIICPPVLQEYWHETFFDFGIRGFKVESLGKLDQIIKSGADRFDYIFIDEAHRFRNELTQGYEKLHQICFGKKVILVSATPLNNTIEDIYSQLKVFQVPKKSTIPGVQNLDKFFAALKKRMNKYQKTDPEYIDTIKQVSKEVRDRILKFVMVRRTRTEVIKYFSEDMQKQGVAFPELDNPKRIVYTFDEKTEKVFNATIALLKNFSYSRYTPLLYLIKPVSEFELQSQRNIGAFMKGILVKRLESSFHAFKKSLVRFVDSYRKFIDMYKQGTVYISKKVNVYDFLDADNDEELLKLVELDKVQKYDSSEFTEAFLVNLQKDLVLFEDIQKLWRDIESDPKLEQFINELKDNLILKENKLVVFTESKETGEYLFKNLNKHLPSRVLFYSSAGGLYGDEEKSIQFARDLIEENFDPKNKQKKDDINILIATDILAEGINLHRSNTVINYDLPWNPTRVLQRVGRVNRVGTKHKIINIFNFFPTAQSDMHLGLEANIKAKIQAFHDTLGEDAKYLTEEEEISGHELFGDSLFKRLSDKKTFQGEDEGERSELEYLQLLRDMRDKDPSFFEKIKRLPKKARTCRNIETEKEDKLLTFFRKGKLKKFFSADGKTAEELTFFEAVDLFKCEPSTPKITTPKTFYPFLDLNKSAFDQATSEETIEKGHSGGSSNESYIMKRLKAREIKAFQGFTDEDEDFLKAALKAFENGVIPKNTSKRLKTELVKEINPLKVLAILKKNLPQAILTPTPTGQQTGYDRREVILSEYLAQSGS